MAYNESTQKYDIPVDYTFTPATGSTPYEVKIPASADGTSVNDNIEVTVLATSRRAATASYRLKLTMESVSGKISLLHLLRLFLFSQCKKIR